MFFATLAARLRHASTVSRSRFSFDTVRIILARRNSKHKKRPRRRSNGPPPASAKTFLRIHRARGIPPPGDRSADPTPAGFASPGAGKTDTPPPGGAPPAHRSGRLRPGHATPQGYWGFEATVAPCRGATADIEPRTRYRPAPPGRS